LILAGVFAHSDIFKLSGDDHHGGAISGNPKSIGIQIIAVLVVFSWSLFWAYSIAKTMSFVPALNLRVSVDDEKEYVGFVPWLSDLIYKGL
jgi:ammonia channel protein AmtB